MFPQKSQEEIADALKNADMEKAVERLLKDEKLFKSIYYILIQGN